MSACPTRFVVGGLLMATTALLTVAFSACTGPASADDPPYTPPLDQRNAIYGTRIDLDGQTYRCVVRASQGIDCDWDHPLQPIQTPTPAPSRTDR